MSRDELKSAADPGGFIEYGKEQLPKIDSMRRDKSQPDFYGVPIMHDDQVLFTRADQIGNKPTSCYTCKEQTKDFTCERLGPGIQVKKVTGSKESGDPIEYWPCCSLHEYTATPREGKVEYHPTLDSPNEIGLIWINAPKPGLKFSGANCGGSNDGDDCDHYLVPSGDKWENPQGYCRVLAHTVEGGDVCAAWWDDDILEWEEAQQLMRGNTSVDELTKKRLAKQIVGRSDTTTLHQHRINAIKRKNKGD